MADQNVSLQKSNALIVDTDLSNIFLYNRRSIKGEINNGDLYDPLVLVKGTVLGRVGATGLLKPFASNAVDGSQYPIAILMKDYTIEEGDTVEVFAVDDGDVSEGKLVFTHAGDTLNTDVSDRIVRDHLKLAGIKCIASTEMTGYDNH
jgi:hypothetical protein